MILSREKSAREILVPNAIQDCSLFIFLSLFKIAAILNPDNVDQFLNPVIWRWVAHHSAVGYGFFFFLYAVSYAG